MAPTSAEAPHSDVLVAIRNTVKLMASLIATWGIALGIRIVLPRFLGAEAYGEIISAERFTETWFIVVSLGIDTYIRKEIPVRPEHANDFFASAMLLRLALTVVVLFGMTAVMGVFNDVPATRELIYVYALAQVFSLTKDTLAALLHSAGKVDGLSVNNVVGKLVWGTGVVLSIVFGKSLLGIAGALCVSKALESAGCFWLCRRHMKLSLTNVSFGPLKLVVLSSLPFFLNAVFHTVYNKIDVYILDKILSNQESGWYGAASQLTSVAMMIAPIMGWVVMPLFARALSRSQDEFFSVVRRSTELILQASIPISLALFLGAETWIRLLSGPEFGPAAAALRLLAPIYTVIYVSMVSAIALNLLNRAWTVTLISLIGMLVNPVLNLLLIQPAMNWWGPGGGGVGCASVQFITESLVALVMFGVIGRRAFDRRTLLMLSRTAVVCGLVWAGHHYVWAGVEGMFGFVRMVIDGVVYVALAVSLKAVNVRELRDFAVNAFRAKQGATA